MENELMFRVRWMVGTYHMAETPRQKDRSSTAGTGALPCDVDLMCVKFGKSGDCLGAVYFHNKGENGIVHGGEAGGCVKEHLHGKKEHTAKEMEDDEHTLLRLSDIKQNV